MKIIKIIKFNKNNKFKNLIIKLKINKNFKNFFIVVIYFNIKINNYIYL